MSVKKHEMGLLSSNYLRFPSIKAEKFFVRCSYKGQKNRDINRLIDISVKCSVIINIGRSFGVIVLLSVRRLLFPLLDHLFSTVMLEYS